MGKTGNMPKKENEIKFVKWTRNETNNFPPIYNIHADFRLSRNYNQQDKTNPMPPFLNKYWSNLWYN